MTGLMMVAWWMLAPLQESRPTLDQVRTQLRSEVPAQIAWGAHHVATARMRGTSGDLVRQLERLARIEGRVFEEELALGALLDAVLRCEAKVPVELLKPLLKPGMNLPAVLVCVAPDAIVCADELLALLTDRVTNPEWYAACGLLAAVAPQRVVPRLLDYVHEHVQIDVVEPRGVHEGHMAFPGGEVRVQMQTVPAGFPPAARYRLDSDSAGEELVAGPVPLFFRRDAGQPAVPWKTIGRAPVHRASAVGLLRNLAGQADTAAFFRLGSMGRCMFHPWSDAAALTAAVREYRAPLEAEWQELLRALVAKKLLPAAEAGKHPLSLSVKLNDRRNDQTTPLPDVER